MGAYVPVSGTLDLYDNSIFNFLRPLHTFHGDGTNLQSHLQWTKIPFLSASLPGFFFLLSFCFFNGSYSNRCGGHVTVVFIFIPAWSVTLSVCPHTPCPFDYLLWKKMSIQVLCSLNMNSFVIWIACSLLSCISLLQILDISPLSDIWFYKYFLPLSRNPFHVDCFLVVQKLSVWHSPAFRLIFHFAAWASGVISGKITAPDPRQGRFPWASSGILLPQVFQILHADLQHALGGFSECVRDGLSCVAWHVVR